MVVHAGGQTFFTILRHCIGGQCDDGHALADRRALSFADLLRGREPVHLGHLTIHQNEIEGGLRVRIHRFLAIAGDRHVVAVDLQHGKRDHLVDGIVFHQQNASANPGRRRGHGLAHGRRRVSLLRLTGHYVYQTFVQRCLTHRLREADVDTGVACVPHIRQAAGQHDQSHLGNVGAGPDRARELERVHARQPQVDDDYVVGSASCRRVRKQLDRLLRRFGNPIGHSPVAHLRLEDAARDGGRFDDERAHARKHPHWSRTRVFMRLAFLLVEAAGEPKRGAGAECGLDVNLPPHHFHELLADREAEAGAAVLAGR